MPSRNLHSAGLLMYQLGPGSLVRVLLAHPGGPFFARKDAGAWSIPKGEVEPGEEALACAQREFAEETGVRPEAAVFHSLGEVKQRGGKRVEAWAFQGDWDGRPPASNTFTLEWPPRSGRMQSFPEIDRLELFELEPARVKLNTAQLVFLDRLVHLLATLGPHG